MNIECTPQELKELLKNEDNKTPVDKTIDVVINLDGETTDIINVSNFK